MVQLIQLINEARNTVLTGRVYKHFRNGFRYKVLHIAINEESLKPVIVYKALYGDNIVFTRKLESWNSQVTYNQNIVPRFQLQLEDELV